MSSPAAPSELAASSDEDEPPSGMDDDIAAAAVEAARAKAQSALEGQQLPMAVAQEVMGLLSGEGTAAAAAGVEVQPDGSLLFREVEDMEIVFGTAGITAVWGATPRERATVLSPDDLVATGHKSFKKKCLELGGHSGLEWAMYLYVRGPVQGDTPTQRGAPWAVWTMYHAPRGEGQGQGGDGTEGSRLQTGANSFKWLQQGSPASHLHNLRWYAGPTCAHQHPGGGRCNAMLVMGRCSDRPAVLLFRHVGRCHHKKGSSAGFQSQLLQLTARYHARLIQDGALTAEAVLAAQQKLAHLLALMYGNKMAAAHSKSTVRQQERRRNLRQQQQQQQAAGGGAGSSMVPFHRSCERVRDAAEAARRRQVEEAGISEHVKGWLQVFDTAPGHFMLVVFTAAGLRLFAHYACRTRADSYMALEDATGGVVCDIEGDMVMVTRILLPHPYSLVPGMQRHDRRRGITALQALHVVRSHVAYQQMLLPFKSALDALPGSHRMAGLMFDHDLAEQNGASIMLNRMPVAEYATRAEAECGQLLLCFQRVVGMLAAAGKLDAAKYAVPQRLSWAQVGEVLKLYEEHHGGSFGVDLTTLERTGIDTMPFPLVHRVEPMLKDMTILGECYTHFMRRTQLLPEHSVSLRALPLPVKRLISSCMVGLFAAPFDCPMFHGPHCMTFAGLYWNAAIALLQQQQLTVGPNCRGLVVVHARSHLNQRLGKAASRYAVEFALVRHKDGRPFVVHVGDADAEADDLSPNDVLPLEGATLAAWAEAADAGTALVSAEVLANPLYVDVGGKLPLADWAQNNRRYMAVIWPMLRLLLPKQWAAAQQRWGPAAEMFTGRGTNALEADWSLLKGQETAAGGKQAFDTFTLSSLPVMARGMVDFTVSAARGSGISPGLLDRLVNQQGRQAVAEVVCAASRQLSTASPPCGFVHKQAQRMQRWLVKQGTSTLFSWLQEAAGGDKAETLAECFEAAQAAGQSDAGQAEQAAWLLRGIWEHIPAELLPSQGSGSDPAPGGSAANAAQAGAAAGPSNSPAVEPAAANAMQEPESRWAKGKQSRRQSIGLAVSPSMEAPAQRRVAGPVAQPSFTDQLGSQLPAAASQPLSQAQACKGQGCTVRQVAKGCGYCINCCVIYNTSCNATPAHKKRHEEQRQAKPAPQPEAAYQHAQPAGVPPAESMAFGAVAQPGALWQVYQQQQSLQGLAGMDSAAVLASLSQHQQLGGVQPGPPFPGMQFGFASTAHAGLYQFNGMQALPAAFPSSIAAQPGQSNQVPMPFLPGASMPPPQHMQLQHLQHGDPALLTQPFFPPMPPPQHMQQQQHSQHGDPFLLTQPFLPPPMPPPQHMQQLGSPAFATHEAGGSRKASKAHSGKYPSNQRVDASPAQQRKLPCPPGA